MKHLTLLGMVQEHLAIQDLESARFKQLAQTVERKKTRVLQIENTAFSVIELSEQQHQASNEEADVACRYDISRLRTRRVAAARACASRSGER